MHAKHAFSALAGCRAGIVPITTARQRLHCVQARSVANVAHSSRPFRLAVIGSGPAGFYSAYRVMARMEHAIVDMYEQLPVPFGLVRFGVAPDHPEVKNCTDKFSEVAMSPRFNFFGNVEVGKDVKLWSLRENYDAVLFAYGAAQDRALGIPGENLRGIYSARAFVGWYNGLPEYANLQPDLTRGETAVVIGQGNVALDVARVLLSGVDRLRATDMTAQAIETLSQSKVKRVHIVGRRGPLQASFTIKEIRELITLPGVRFSPIKPSLLPADDKSLPRTQRRMVQLLKKHSNSGISEDVARAWSLDFLQSPTSFRHSASDPQRLLAIDFNKNVFANGQGQLLPSAKVEATSDTSTIETPLAFRSIGYKSVPLPGMSELGIDFDGRAGTIRNEVGRVLAVGGEQVPGIYCTGWVKNGPTGVIANTMDDAFATAETIAEDWARQDPQSEVGETRHGWEGLRSEVRAKAVGWQDWLKIDAAERERGKRLGKEREKIQSVEEILSVI